MPMESPIRKLMSTIQRFAYGRPACSYHFVMAQNTRAVTSDDMA